MPDLEARRRRLVLLALCAAALVINIDVSIVNVTLPSLVRELHATTTNLQWIVETEGNRRAINRTFLIALQSSGNPTVVHNPTIGPTRIARRPMNRRHHCRRRRWFEGPRLRSGIRVTTKATPTG